MFATPVRVSRHTSLLRSTAVIACAASLIGCGGGDDASVDSQRTPTPAPQASPAAARASLTAGQVRTADYSLTEQQFMDRYGAPAEPFRDAGKSRCGFYDVPGQDPAFVQWKVCFRKDKLDLVQSLYH